MKSTLNITLRFSFMILVLLLVSAGCKSSDTNTPEQPIIEESSDAFAIPGTVRNISSLQFVAEMGIGWNLGNSFDVEDRDKTAWGNPLPTKAMVDFIAQAGFKTLRVPVTWGYHQQATAPYTVESEYLDRVQKVVNYGLENNMHVILNTHHDDPWILPLYTNESAVSPRLAALWTQIAERFKVYGDKLIFETLNEPRLEGSPEEWTGGTEEGREVLNTYHKTCLDAIRATGGNNAKRHIMISTYAASTLPVAMNSLEIPNNDANVIISLHTYFPWEFAGLPVVDGGVAIWGSDTDKAALVAEMDRIRTKWMVEEQRPVILGEWGTIDKNNINTRAVYADFYVKKAIENGFVPIVWDDGSNFGFFNRTALNWRFPELATAIVDAAN